MTEPADHAEGLNRPQKIAAAVIGAALIWGLLPQFDLGVSALFYRPATGFFLSHAPPLRWIYAGTRWFVGILAALLIAAQLYTMLPTSRLQPAWRGRFAFLILALAIGPGLITNTVLKDHFGRPRPEQTADFGGHMHYVRPLIPSFQCKRNCAFPSGHAAAGFYLIAGAWIWPRRRRTWYIAGCTAGGLIGLVRIAQGGHYVSDVLGAFAVVWGCNEALFRTMRTRGWVSPCGDEADTRAA